tara:strand:+ start:194 stop:1252 length:1059 start_codon:yes stop_codon:yes gene_type:complete
MKDIKSTIIKIKKIAKLNNKISCVFLGNTVQKEKATFYITPIRENKKFVFCSVILFNDFVANKVAKMMDGHINYILVDTEKKIQTKNTNLGLVNIERPIKETIKKSKLRVYKANDLSILSTETLINYYFLNDKRGLSGKKAIIIGAGNIGFKLALKFVENGASTYLIRRNKKFLKNIIQTINIIKPKGTVANAYFLDKIPNDLTNFDIIIGSSDKKNLIKKKHVININNKKLFIDLGKGTFSKDCIEFLLNKKNNIFRLDATSSYFSYLDNMIYTESIYKKDTYINKINNYNFVSQGILGKKDDIIVDDAKKPKKILGVCDGKGNLKKINTDLKNILIKKIKKDIGLKLIYE